MRKVITALLISIGLLALWLWRGRDLSMLIDQFKLIETSSRPINAIAYEGSGTGGILHVDGLDLSFNEVELGGAQPNFGTSKDGQLALSFAGNIFRLGPVQTESLTTSRPADDIATVSIQHSALPWPNFFKINFMTGKSPSWKRHIYQKLVWKKPTGAKLEMVWRYEQYFYGDQGWLDGTMTREGATGLIRIDISNAAR